MKELVKFLDYISKLKLTVRVGWNMRNVPDMRETIGSHSFGVVLISWIMAKKENADVEKTIKMALIHDLLEGIMGDLTPLDKNYHIKDILEKEALKKLDILLPEELKFEVKTLLNELLENKTKESAIVAEADKLDTAFQAYLYEKKIYGKNIDGSTFSEFFDFAQKKCKSDFSKEFLEHIKSLRGK
jgi:putative hydrolase of HD superfamily